MTAFTVNAGSGEVNNVWKLTRDSVQNNYIEPGTITREVKCNSHHNKFTCHYIGSDSSNDSIFSGETNFERNNTIITFYQYDNTYYVTHSGLSIGHDKYLGTWYDVEGNSGDFELKK